MGRVDRPSEMFIRTTTTRSLATSATYDARPSEAGWNAADAGYETPRDIWLVHLPLRLLEVVGCSSQAAPLQQGT